MRKKLLIFTIVLLVAMACIVPNVFAFTAADGARMVIPDEEDGVMPISEIDDVMPISDEMNSIDREVYGFSEDVERNGETVNGNVYLCANNITMENEIVNGDVFICANNIQMGKDVIINGNAFICALNAKIDATITRGAYIVGKDISLGETVSVKYDTNICADHVTLNGSFDRDVNVFTNNMEVMKDAIILQDLNYTSDKEANISDEASIINVNFEKRITKSKETIDIVYDYVLDFTQYFVLTFVTLIIVMKIIPNFIRKSKECVRVSAFGIGIVAIVLMPIIFIALMMFRLTATIAIAALIMMLAILLISMAITNIAIGAKLAGRFKKIKFPIHVAIVTMISWAVYQIPFFGGIVAFFMVATGLGIVLRANFVKEK